jgi:hypothetical protein
MIESIEDLQAAIAGGDEDKKVTNQNRQDWNDYVKHLQKRGVAGDPKLDKNGLGKNMLAQYIKDNPSTSLTPEMVSPIQHDFANYRQWAINNIKAGKGEFAKGTDENNFMKELSIVDNYPGSFTTRHTFPSEYLTTFENTQNMGTENKGFSTVKN